MRRLCGQSIKLHFIINCKTLKLQPRRCLREANSAGAALQAAVKPTKAESWAAIDLIRERIRARHGGDLSDSTPDIIREDRDNHEPYR